LPRLIAKAEAHDPARVIRELEPFVTERRRQRLREVIDRRVGSVSVVFDAPYDPHNGAAIVRTCEAFGVQRLHVVERTLPFLAARSVARGAQKWIDVIAWSSASDAASALESEGFELVAADVGGALLPSDLGAIPKLALVLGNERDGVGDDLLRACKRRVRVPMRGFVESLNVSVTAAILVAAATTNRPGDLSESDRLRLYARGLYFSVHHADDVLTLGGESD
jgi:tRNA (guanosine-2'-O-)-methyltransferase